MKVIDDIFRFSHFISLMNSVRLNFTFSSLSIKRTKPKRLSKKVGKNLLYKKSFQCPIRERKAIKEKSLKEIRRLFSKLNFRHVIFLSSLLARSILSRERIHFLILLISFVSLRLNSFKKKSHFFSPPHRHVLQY